jgi:hypothetical protein
MAGDFQKAQEKTTHIMRGATSQQTKSRSSQDTHESYRKELFY